MYYESLERLLGLSVVTLQVIALLIFQNHSELLDNQRGARLASNLVVYCHDLKNGWCCARPPSEEVGLERCSAMLVAKKF